LINKELPDRRSHRLVDHDYTKEGAYFVTLCTYENRKLFGRILDEKMHSSSAGRIAKRSG
jgi:hypothetical protein